MRIWKRRVSESSVGNSLTFFIIGETAKGTAIPHNYNQRGRACWGNNRWFWRKWLCQLQIYNSWGSESWGSSFTYKKSLNVRIVQISIEASAFRLRSGMTWGIFLVFSGPLSFKQGWRWLRWWLWVVMFLLELVTQNWHLNEYSWKSNAVLTTNGCYSIQTVLHKWPLLLDLRKEMKKTHGTAQWCSLKSSGSKIISVKMVGRGMTSQSEYKILRPLKKRGRKATWWMWVYA